MRAVAGAFAVVLQSLALIGWSGCADSPAESYDRMVQAAAIEDEEVFYEGLTQPSQELLRRMTAIAENTRGQLSLIRSPYSILPPGEVVDERIEGNLAILTLDNGREQHRVPMVRKDGEWRLEMWELESFWERLR